MSFSKPSFRERKLGWYSCHRSHVNAIVRRQAKVVLLGDSLVANLGRYPSVWDRHLEAFNTVNCGIGGDRTQHVLWRADNMYLPDSVSVVVIHCGTNNIGFNVFRPHDIAHSVVSCGTRLREKFPHLNIIVAGILPRDTDGSTTTTKIQQTNDNLKTLCCDEGIVFIEQASYWTTSSGELNQNLFWKDNLHLNKRGCNMFAKSIARAINNSLPTPPTPPSPPTLPFSPIPTLPPTTTTPTPTPTPTPYTYTYHTHTYTHTYTHTHTHTYTHTYTSHPHPHLHSQLTPTPHTPTPHTHNHTYTHTTAIPTLPPTYPPTPTPTPTLPPLPALHTCTY